MSASSIRRRVEDPIPDSLGSILSVTVKTWGRILPTLAQLSCFGFAPLWFLWGWIASTVHPIVFARFSGELAQFVQFAALIGSWIGMHQIFAASVAPAVLRAHRRLDEGIGSSRSRLFGRFVALAVIAALSGLSTFVGILAGVLPGLIVATTWILASSVLAVEGGSIRRAFGRSARLTAGRRFRGATLLVGVSVAIFVLSTWTSLALLFAAPKNGGTDEIWLVLVAFVVGFAGSLLDVLIAVTYLVATDRVEPTEKDEVSRIFE